MNDKAQKALEIWREENSGVYVKRKNLIEKWEERPTRTTAIHAMCYQCMGGDEEYNPRSAIRSCSSGECPLYVWRPYK
jgi:hypothetical protein